MGDQCTKHAERISKLEAERVSDHSWIEDIHEDHEKTKTKLQKVEIRLAILVTSATLAGNVIYSIIKNISPITKVVLHFLMPNSYAGN